MILCDTGPLVAAAVRNDVNYHRCVELFTGLRLARRRLLVPMTVVAEVGYLLETRVGRSLRSTAATSRWCALVMWMRWHCCPSNEPPGRGQTRPARPVS